MPINSCSCSFRSLTSFLYFASVITPSSTKSFAFSFSALITACCDSILIRSFSISTNRSFAAVYFTSSCIRSIRFLIASEDILSNPVSSSYARLRPSTDSLSSCILSFSIVFSTANRDSLPAKSSISSAKRLLYSVASLVACWLSSYALALPSISPTS